MKLVINGESIQYDGEPRLSDLLTARGHDAESVAVARNGSFVPRGKYAETKLSDGDEIEVVAPMQGG